MSENIVATMSGARMDVSNPRPEDFRILDVVSSLSKKYRFSGNLAFDCNTLGSFYSVMDHSIIVLEIVNYLTDGVARDRLKVQALCHDFTEAYLNDIPQPAKLLCSSYRELEDRLWSSAIAPALNLAPLSKGEMALFKRADYMASYIEAQQFGTYDFYTAFKDQGVGSQWAKACWGDADQMIWDTDITQKMLALRNKTARQTVITSVDRMASLGLKVDHEGSEFFSGKEEASSVRNERSAWKRGHCSLKPSFKRTSIAN